jgi:hypothetical protein
MNEAQRSSELDRPTMLAVAAALATACLKVASRAPTPWVGDLGFVLAPAIMAAVAGRLLVARRVGRGFAALGRMVVVALAALLIYGLSNVVASALRPPDWRRAEMKLPDGLGTVTLSARSLHRPSVFPVPGPFPQTWRVKFEPAHGAPLTIRLPERIVGLEMTVAISEDKTRPILHLAYPELGSIAGGTSDVYLDPRSGQQVGPRPGPEEVLGRFDMMGRDGARFAPNPERRSRR